MTYYNEQREAGTGGLPRGSKIALWGVLGLMVGSSFLFQLAYAITPLGYIGKFGRPLIERPPKPHPADQKSFEWIRQHTTFADRFFPYSADFVRETGRATPGPFLPNWGYPDEIAAYRKIIQTCSRREFDRLGIRYLYVSPQFPIPDFESACLRRLEAVRPWHIQEGGESRSVYRLL